jgi:ATPase subunit of ABC transporter with duplicated ATPase domains
LDFSLEKGMTVGITGKNGMGKSLLLQILAGKLEPSTGQVHRKGSLWHVPQHFGQFDRLTVENALGIDAISKSLEAIAHGSMDPSHYSRCEGNWDILDTVGGLAPYTWPASQADSRVEYFKVISADSCGNVSDDELVIEHNTLLLKSNVDVCGGTNTLAWNRYRGWGNS